MPVDRVAYVVDDEATVRRSLALLLRSAGFSVQDFDCGDAFLRAAPALPFGCVLLDLRMPGMDGLAVQREMAPRGVRLPVVIVTAHGDVALAVAGGKRVDRDAQPGEAGSSGALHVPAVAVATAPGEHVEPAGLRDRGRDLLHRVRAVARHHRDRPAALGDDGRRLSGDGGTA